MSVNIRKMTNDEFQNFYQWSVEHHAKELMEEMHISPEEAIKETIEEVAAMLPDALNTKNNCLMSIVEADSDEIVGFIWTIYEDSNGRKQSFLCDFAIWKSKRRRGYGEAALCLAEKNAKEAGCQESVLFVADQNVPARALYQKSGYQFLRKAGCGMYMIKHLLQYTTNHIP